MKKFVLLIIFLFISFLTVFAGSVCASDVLKVNSVHFDNSDKFIFISAKANDGGARTFKIYSLKEPNRVYFDIENAVLNGQKREFVFDKSPIKELVISQNSNTPPIVRVVITLAEDAMASAVKVSQIDSNIVINYNGKPEILGNYFKTIFRDFSSSKNDYYQYLKINLKTVERNTIPITKPDMDRKILEQISSSFENTTLNNSDGVNYDIVKKENITEKMDLKTGYYLKLAKFQNDGILIQGIGQVQIEPPMILTSPSRLVIDLPNTYVNPEIRNKEIPFGDSGETFKIGQFEVNKARIVVATEETSKYLPIFSPDNQSIFLVNTDKLKSAYVSQTKTNVSGYYNKRIDKYTGEFMLTFTNPVIVGVRRNPDSFTAYFLNAEGYNEAYLQRALSQAGLKDIKLSLMSNIGIRMTCPLSRDKVIRFEESVNGKAVKLVVSSPIPLTTKQKEKSPVYGAVVIDPGHGGMDYGAVRAGINEKDINLEVSRLIQANLLARGYQVYMTRTDDAGPSLQDRVDFCEGKKPDVFVSIHVNSSVKNDIYGVETHWYHDYSNEFAEIVHKHLVKNVPTKDRGLFQSKFYVINHTTVPAVLVEMGFISNDAERAVLVTDKRKQQVAKAVADGIIEYINARKK